MMLLTPEAYPPVLMFEFMFSYDHFARLRLPMSLSSNDTSSSH